MTWIERIRKPSPAVFGAVEGERVDEFLGINANAMFLRVRLQERPKVNGNFHVLTLPEWRDCGKG